MSIASLDPTYCEKEVSFQLQQPKLQHQKKEEKKESWAQMIHRFKAEIPHQQIKSQQVDTTIDDCITNELFQALIHRLRLQQDSSFSLECSALCFL